MPERLRTSVLGRVLTTAEVIWRPLPVICLFIVERHGPNNAAYTHVCNTRLACWISRLHAEYSSHYINRIDVYHRWSMPRWTVPINMYPSQVTCELRKTSVASGEATAKAAGYGRRLAPEKK